MAFFPQHLVQEAVGGFARAMARLDLLNAQRFKLARQRADNIG